MERFVLNTKSVNKVVERNNVVTLVADWSNQDEGEISKTLEALGSKQLPVLAVFSPDDPYRPQVITGTYTKRELIGKIKKAGPSKSAALAKVSKTTSVDRPK